MALHAGRQTMQLTSYLGQQGTWGSNSRLQSKSARTSAPISASVQRVAAGRQHIAKSRRAALVCRAAAEAPTAEAKSLLEDYDIAKTVLLQVS